MKQISAPRRVRLIVPESLLDSDETEYKGHTNVLGFREFCDRHIRPHLSSWRP
jgi:hypothetical protein